MSTVVITGASGFLARHLAPLIKAAGDDVIRVSRRPLPGMVVVPDYRSVPDGDVVIHLAEEPDRSKALPGGDEAIRSAADVVANLTRQFNGRVVYASSAAVYGAEGQRPFRVGDPVTAVDAYSVSKLRNEEMVLHAGGAVARISNLTGAGMAVSNVVSEIMRQVPGAGPVRVRDTGAVRDYIAVQDCAAAFRDMTRSAMTGIVNVGTGIGTSVLELIQFSLDIVHQQDRAIVATHPSNRLSITVLDITETTRTLGWVPAIPLREQLTRLICTNPAAA